MTKTMMTIFRVVFEGPLQIAYYGYLCSYNVTWYSPLLIVGYWLVAYVVNKLLMNPSVKAVFRQEQLEGHFRFGHVRVRTHSESIALYGAGRREEAIANVTFSALMRNRLRLICWESALTSTTNVFAYFASVINYTIIALPIFRGWKLPPTAGSAAAYVSNASFQLIMFINGFTQFNNISRDMADFIGYSNRVAQMFETMDKLKRSDVSQHLKDSIRNDPYYSLTVNSSPYESNSEIDSVDSSEGGTFIPASKNSSGSNSASTDRTQSPLLKQKDGTYALNAPRDDVFLLPSPEIRFKKVSVFTPTGQALIKNLTLSISAGTNLLITGPNGSGKSSLIRCLSGLWRSFDGEIARPSSVLFLPQQPYLPYGNLQDQIMYPLTSAESLLGLPSSQKGRNNVGAAAQIENDQLLDILRTVELQYLVNRPDIADSLSIATRETLRSIIEDHQDDDDGTFGMAAETTGLLAAVAHKNALSTNASTLLQQIESKNLNWTEVLSPGEQQRIGLGRVLFHKPCFAILDESTSNVDESLETQFYNTCKEQKITLVSVSHKSGLKKFHQLHLEIDRKGRCQLHNINGEQ